MTDTDKKTKKKLSTLRDFVEEYYIASTLESQAKKRKEEAKKRIFAMKKNKPVERDVFDNEYALNIHSKVTSKKFDKEKFEKEHPALAKSLEKFERLKPNYLIPKEGLSIRVSKIDKI